VSIECLAGAHAIILYTNYPLIKSNFCKISVIAYTMSGLL